MKQLLTAFGVIALAAAAGASAPAPPSSSVDLLITQLGADQFTDREAATAALEASGPAAIPALEHAVRDPNPEVARRAAGVLAKLQRAADSHTRLVARTVRLAYKDVPLGTAVNDLRARTGLNLTLDPANVADPLRLVTCETGDLPAWEAVAAFCRAAGLKEVFVAELEVPKTEPRRNRGYYTPPPPAPPADAVPVTLADGKYVSLPGTRATAVRVLALPASFPAHRVILGTGEVTLHFDVAPAPGLNWQDVNGVRVTKAIDDAGRFGGGGALKELPPPADPFDGAVLVNRRMALRFEYDGPVAPTAYPNPRVVPVPLRLATPSARSLRLLEGVVVCEVAIPEQPLVTVEDLTRRAGIPVEGLGGAKVTVLEIRHGEKGVGATVRVQTETPSPWQAQRRLNPWGPLWPEQSRPVGLGTQIKAFDAAGKPMTPASTSGNQFSEDGTTLSTVTSMTFAGAAPAKLIFVGPKPTLVEIPFRMENVPLP
ncbi:MAG: hypothetical protein JWO38_5970 [Gemmataceae bacterium]|nr:hypothetical protein [Gemmataceae bacterium]